MASPLSYTDVEAGIIDPVTNPVDLKPPSPLVIRKGGTLHAEQGQHHSYVYPAVATSTDQVKIIRVDEHEDKGLQ